MNLTSPGITLFITTGCLLIPTLGLLGDEIGPDPNEKDGLVPLAQITLFGQKQSGPASQISVIDRKTIDQARVFDINDIDFLTPSLTHIDPGNPIESFPIIRGIGSLYNAGEFSVGLFTDGIYHGADHYFSQDQLDLERIEVLKGPQTTLYGKSTVGGAVSIHTKEPMMDSEFSANSWFGERGYFQQQAVANLPDPNERFALRVAYQHKEFDGFYQNPTTKSTRDSERLEHVRIKGLYKVNDRLTLNAMLAYRSLDADSYVYHQVADDTDYRGSPYAVNFPPRAAIDVLKLSLKATLELNDQWHLHSNIGTSLVEQRDNIDVDYSPTVATPLSPTADIRALRANDRNDFSQEFRITSPREEAVRGQAGLFFFGLQDDLDQSVFFESPVSITQPAPMLSDRNSYTLSGYGQVEWDVTPRITISTALRYDRESRELLDRGLGLNKRRHFDFLSPTLTLSWAPHEKNLFYGRFAFGSRAGGLNIGAFPEFNQEETISYEIGWKRSFLNGRLSVTGALFWTDIQDRQSFALDIPTFTEFVSNQGDARVLGAELESFIDVTERLRLGVSGMLMDATYRDYTAVTLGPIGGGSFELDGNRLPYVPKYELLTTVLFHYPVYRNTELFVRTDYRFTGGRYWHEFNTDQQEAYGVANFRAGLRGESWELMGFVENAFDTSYFTNYVPSFRFPFSGSALAVNGTPRFYGLKFAFRF